MDRAVGDHRAQRGAALAGGAEAAEQGALDGQVEVGVGHHHQRVLAAQLQAGHLEVAAAELADAAPDLGGAGEADLVDQAGLQGGGQALEGGRAVGLDQVEDAVGQAGVPAQLGQGLGGGRGALGRLPDDRVAAQQRRDQVPGRHRHREVAGGDHRRHPDRLAEGEQLLVRHLARHRLAVEPPALAGEEVAGVDDLGDLAPGLGQRLADLGGDQAGQGLGVLLHQPAQVLDHPPPHRGRRGRPPGLGLPGGRGRRSTKVAGLGQQHLGDHVGGVGRVDRPVPAAALGPPPADTGGEQRRLLGHGSNRSPKTPVRRAAQEGPRAAPFPTMPRCCCGWASGGRACSSRPARRPSPGRPGRARRRGSARPGWRWRPSRSRRWRPRCPARTAGRRSSRCRC